MPSLGYKQRGGLALDTAQAKVRGLVDAASSGDWRAEFKPIAEHFLKLKKKKDVKTLVSTCTTKRGPVVACSYCNLSFHLACLLPSELEAGKLGAAGGVDGARKWACPTCRDDDEEEPPANKFVFTDSRQHDVLLKKIKPYLRQRRR